MHWIFFSVWALLFLIDEVIKLRIQAIVNDESKDLIRLKLGFTNDLVYLAKYVCLISLNSFLLYLTIRFAKSNRRAEIKDPILGRKVPDIVFL